MVLFNLGIKDDKKDESKGIDPKLETAGFDARGDLVFDRIDVDPRTGIRTIVFTYTSSPNNLLLPESSLRTRIVNLLNHDNGAFEELKALAALEAL